MSLSPVITEIMRISTYETRAWTFQERLLSRRRLYLTHWHAYFQCQEDLRCEGWDDLGARNSSNHRSLNPFAVNPLSDTGDLLSPPSPGKSAIPWREGFDIYVKLVHTYTQRKLSYPSDILNAFCGISAAIERLCGGTFICGLPKAILDLALLWTPSGPMTRRSSNILDSSQRETKFPTWSWAGWLGPVSYNWIGPVKPGWVGLAGYFEGLLSTTHEFWPDLFVSAVSWVRI